MLFACSPVFFLLICCSYDIIIEYLFYYFLFLLGIVLHAYAYVYVLQGALYRHIYVILKLVAMPQAYFFAFICMCLFYR